MREEKRFGVAAFHLGSAMFAKRAVAQAFLKEIAVDRLRSGGPITGRNDHLAIRGRDTSGGV